MSSSSSSSESGLEVNNKYNIIKTALAEFGITEKPGIEDNSPRILEYFKEIGQTWVKTDETAWCSAFVNFIAKVTGHEYTGKLNARSWLDVGEDTDKPEVGDIVVLWREDPDSWKGHVGFFIKTLGNYVWILGGNQGNKVQISRYPLSRLLSYRVLRFKS